MTEKKKVYTISKASVKVFDSKGEQIFNNDSELIFLRTTFIDILEQVVKARSKFKVYNVNGHAHYQLVCKDEGLKKRMFEIYHAKNPKVPYYL